MTFGYEVSFCTVYMWFISYNKHHLGPLLVQEYISTWPAADVSSAVKINTTVTCTHGSFIIYLIHVELNSKGWYRFLRVFSFLCPSHAGYNLVEKTMQQVICFVMYFYPHVGIIYRQEADSPPVVSHYLSLVARGVWWEGGKRGRETAPARARYAKTIGDESGLEEHFSPLQLFLT